MAITESYNLQPSPLFTVNGREEVTADFQLQASATIDQGVLSGIVRLPDGTRLPQATVKLFSSTGIPFEHVTSNEAGRFIFPTVPTGSYFITASLPTYLTPVRIPVSIVRNRNTEVTINMERDPNGTRNAIFGIVRNSVTNQEITNATVQLFRTNGTERVEVGTVTTNNQGQYIFANLPDGSYSVSASSVGYFSNEGATVTVANRDFASNDVLLVQDPRTNIGTVSGIITSAVNNQPLANAIVALYSVTNGVEQIIDITKTNAGGLYLFGDVPSGTYRVKATVQVETTT
jgi:5-hydroxyisourate hydrolase-like protein (transthyretin family)